MGCVRSLARTDTGGQAEGQPLRLDLRSSRSSGNPVDSWPQRDGAALVARMQRGPAEAEPFPASVSVLSQVDIRSDR